MSGWYWKPASILQSRVIIVPCNVYYLLSTTLGTLSWRFYKSRTGGRNMDCLIKRLIRDAFQTGFFVSLFALCHVGVSCEFCSPVLQNNDHRASYFSVTQWH